MKCAYCPCQLVILDNTAWLIRWDIGVGTGWGAKGPGSPQCYNRRGRPPPPQYLGFVGCTPTPSESTWICIHIYGPLSHIAHTHYQMDTNIGIGLIYTRPDEGRATPNKFTIYKTFMMSFLIFQNLLITSTVNNSDFFFFLVAK